MKKPSIADIIQRGIEMKASDIHITVNYPPAYRVNGSLIFNKEDKPLIAEDTIRLGKELLPGDKAEKSLENNGQVDFCNSFSDLGRLRVNLYKQQGNWAAAIRLIPCKIIEFDNLGLPPVVKELAMKEKGLILVTGVTGSGKSTTLAAMIDLINKTKSFNILTLEDPIEYVHNHGTCIINQREIGEDTASFALGLRAALRQDPDVILVGEMRDLETISTAVTAAETGHLVLATLHSGSAVQTIERIVDVFPPYQQSQISLQLATTLQGVISQQLIPRVDGTGRIVAAEILVTNPAVRNLIRENKIHQIYSLIQTGSADHMITMEKAIKILLQQGIISYDEASKRLQGL